MMQDANKLTPCFVPSLVATLLSAEDKKGAPLSKDEVIHIRDNAPCIMMEASDIRKLEESRGYRDTDPENCWHDWQMTRRELGRQPGLDPGPRFGHIRTEDSDYQATIRQAHETLEQFRGMLPNDGSPREYASVKTELAYEDDRAFMWLCNTAIESEGFVAELFEVPDCLPNHTVGARLHIATAELLDWMVIDHGVLHGGFSLRYHRSTLSESEQLDFDRHIGVTRFA